MPETTTKKRRGRPPKAKEAIPAEKVKEEEPEVYNHMRFKRCGRKVNGNSHPTFLRNAVICNGLMKSFKTTDGGKYKHYRCERCQEVEKVEGVKI